MRVDYTMEILLIRNKDKYDIFSTVLDMFTFITYYFPHNCELFDFLPIQSI